MIDEPKIVRTEANTAAVIRLTISRAEIQRHGPAMGEVRAVVAAQGIVARDNKLVLAVRGGGHPRPRDHLLLREHLPQ